MADLGQFELGHFDSGQSDLGQFDIGQFLVAQKILNDLGKFRLRPIRLAYPEDLNPEP